MPPSHATISSVPTDLEEATTRGTLRRIFHRLPDGTFAPKGRGMVLSPGETIHVPHRGGRGTVPAVVTHHYDAEGSLHGGTPTVTATLASGPDKGQRIAVRATPAAAAPGAGRREIARREGEDFISKVAAGQRAAGKLPPGDAPDIRPGAVVRVHDPGSSFHGSHGIVTTPSESGTGAVRVKVEGVTYPFDRAQLRAPGAPSPGRDAPADSAARAEARQRDTGMAWRYKDARGVPHVGFVESTSDRGGTDVTYHFRDAHTGELSVLGGPAVKRDAASLNMTVGQARAQFPPPAASPGRDMAAFRPAAIDPKENPSALLDRLAGHPDALGHGYLGNRSQLGSNVSDAGREYPGKPSVQRRVDRAVVSAARELGWTDEQLFRWANSKDGRWYSEENGGFRRTTKAAQDRADALASMRRFESAVVPREMPDAWEQAGVDVEGKVYDLRRGKGMEAELERVIAGGGFEDVDPSGQLDAGDKALQAYVADFVKERDRDGQITDANSLDDAIALGVGDYAESHFGGAASPGRDRFAPPPIPRSREELAAAQARRDAADEAARAATTPYERALAREEARAAAAQINGARFGTDPSWYGFASSPGRDAGAYRTGPEGFTSADLERVKAIPDGTPVVLRTELWGGAWTTAKFLSAYDNGDALVNLAGRVRRIGAWRVHPLDQFVAGKYASTTDPSAARFAPGDANWNGQIVHPIDPSVPDGRSADRPGAASPGRDRPGGGSGMAPDWDFIQRLSREQGTDNPVGSLEDLARAWTGADPEEHRKALDAIAAGRRARRGGASPGRDAAAPTPQQLDAARRLRAVDAWKGARVRMEGSLLTVTTDHGSTRAYLPSGAEAWDWSPYDERPRPGSMVATLSPDRHGGLGQASMSPAPAPPTREVTDEELGAASPGRDAGAYGDMPFPSLVAEIRRDWIDQGLTDFAAQPYLSAMSTLDHPNQRYGFDMPGEVVHRFLANSSRWKGEKARVIKAELRRRLGEPAPDVGPATPGRPAASPGRDLPEGVVPGSQGDAWLRDVAPGQRVGVFLGPTAGWREGTALEGGGVEVNGELHSMPGDTIVKPIGPGGAMDASPSPVAPRADAAIKRAEDAWDARVSDPSADPRIEAEPDVIRELVRRVPPGGYFAGGGDVLNALDRLTPEARRAAFEQIATPDLARLYLTAEDANFHTLNEDVAAVLQGRLGPDWFSQVARTPGAQSPGRDMSGEQRAEIVRQIGQGNVLSISGGRVTPIADGIELPVSSGYRVRVHLDPSDTYTVERVMVRGGREFPKGSRSNVYADEVGEVAYRAGMYKSWDESEWPSAQSPGRDAPGRVDGWIPGGSRLGPRAASMGRDDKLRWLTGQTGLNPANPGGLRPVRGFESVTGPNAGRPLPTGSRLGRRSSGANGSYGPAELDAITRAVVASGSPAAPELRGMLTRLRAGGLLTDLSPAQRDAALRLLADLPESSDANSPAGRVLAKLRAIGR